MKAKRRQVMDDSADKQLRGNATATFQSVPKPNALSPRLLAKLQHLHPRVQMLPIAHFLWEQRLTTAEQQKLLARLAQLSRANDKSTILKDASVEENQIRECYANLGGPMGWWRIMYGGSNAEALLAAAKRASLLDAEEHDVLLAELGGHPQRKNPPAKPHWNRNDGELWFGGQVVRQVDVSRAKNVVAVLDAFDAQGWPSWINDQICNDDVAGWRSDTIKGLNKNLQVIEFRVSGDRICWRQR